MTYDNTDNNDDGTVEADIDNQSVSTEQINSEYRIEQSDGESELRSVVENATYGDKVVLPPQYNVTLSQTLTIPSGVMVVGSAKEQNGQPTLTKGFNGALVEYNDWVTLKNIHLDGNRGSGYTGDGLAYETKNTRECLFETVAVENCEGAALNTNEFFLCTVRNTQLINSGVGIRQEGTQHGPHTLWSRVYVFNNDGAGIKSNWFMDRNAWVKCYIDGNGGAGIDVSDSNSGIGWASPLIGTTIQRNDGPAILTDDQSVSLKISEGSILSNNLSNPDGSLTTPVGEVHSETGAQINGTVAGVVGDIRTYGSHPPAHLTVTGNAGDIDDTDIFLSAVDSDKVGNINVRGATVLDPISRAVNNGNGEPVYGVSGSATRSGDGSATTFSIINGSLSTLINSAQVTPASPDANGDFHIDVLGGRVDIIYETAPPSGTDNLAWEYIARF